MKFNEKLLDLRKKKGWSQEELGYKLEVSRQTISKWEAGQTTPELEKLVKLSEIFEITVDELIKDDNKISNKVENEIDNNIKSKKMKKKSKLKIIILVILLGVLICYAIIVAYRIKIIFSVENILGETLQKYNYLNITRYTSRDDDYSNFEILRFENNNISKYKVDNRDIVYYEEYNGKENRCIELNSSNSTYRILESLPIDYRYNTHNTSIFSEYQKYYNDKYGYFSFDMLLFAMDLRIVITTVDNAGMQGFYISDRTEFYEDYCRIKVDTLTETIELEERFFKDEAKDDVLTKVYRFKYSENLVEEEDVTIPDLSGYTLVE